MNGPRIVGATALLLVCGCGALLAVHGAGEEGVRAMVRATARCSVVLFSAAFAAAALRRLSPSPLSRWLLRNRRWLGLSFALSHALHAAALLALRRVAPDFQPDPGTLVGGGFTYLLIAAMAATSNDRAVAWLGRARWRALHRLGGWVIWVVFAQSYLPRAVASPFYLAPVLLLLAVLGLRLMAARRTRPAAAVA
jgi:hypothetical protein